MGPSDRSLQTRTVSDDVIEDISKQVAANSGDCWEALEQLLRVGRLADQDGMNEVKLVSLDF
ncbi:Orc1-type DNA replication protein [Natrialba aegyptia DSM 13077]|uniref:Orc1-type DNA replication protein n=1 Tax=Natrialba aegyptia DSM 13077 TaxID=1227491 RepID=M0AMN8_9EURY|nr:Orc1-type DNA replication protein [Natrialba aegyptia DSM 13077]